VGYLEDEIVMSEKEMMQSPTIDGNPIEYTDDEYTDDDNPVDKKIDAATAPTDLRILGALVRTAFSSEQTLMSWTRTSLSLFTFGFSIAKFFQYLEEQQGGTQLSAGPRRMGIALICVGILALVLAMVEHVHRLRTMREQGLPRISQYLMPFGTALALLSIGIVVLIGVIFDWFI
jgi:putative membrane protein